MDSISESTLLDVNGLILSTNFSIVSFNEFTDSEKSLVDSFSASVSVGVSIGDVGSSGLTFHDPSSPKKLRSFSLSDFLGLVYLYLESISDNLLPILCCSSLYFLASGEVDFRNCSFDRRPLFSFIFLSFLLLRYKSFCFSSYCSFSCLSVFPLLAARSVVIYWFLFLAFLENMDATLLAIPLNVLPTVVFPVSLFLKVFLSLPKDSLSRSSRVNILW